MKPSASRYGLISTHQANTKAAYTATSIRGRATGQEKEKRPVEIEEEEPETEIEFEVETIRTALSVELRDGILYIFIPPMDYLEHYLDIIASIEATATQFKFAGTY